jgi:hypothetical protein
MGLISFDHAAPLVRRGRPKPGPERTPLALRLKPRLMRSSRSIPEVTLAGVIRFEVIHWPLE